MPSKAPSEATTRDDGQFKGGQLKHFIDRWKELQAPEIVVRTLSNYKIPFIQKPPLVLPNLQKPHLQTKVTPAMTQHIIKMEKELVLMKAEQSPSFISRMFLVPKPDETTRPVLNLRPLNEFVATDPFKLINCQRVLGFLQLGDWMVKVDLSQAYFHIPIHPAHRKFLRILFKDSLYEMTCLPFGLSSAPKAFATVSNWIAQYLREKGYRVIVYLDDFMLVNQHQENLKAQVKEFVRLLKYLGWHLQERKSILTPTQELKFLGINWNTVTGQKWLPESKVRKTILLIQSAQERGRCSLNEVQVLLGMLSFASFPVPRGRLHCRNLQIHCRTIRNLGTFQRVNLPEDVKEDLRWWLANIQQRSLIFQRPYTNLLTTDASDLGWGAVLNNKILQGTWPPHQQNLHCNQKEMLGVLAALAPHTMELSGSGLMVQCDNRTVVSYLNKEGGTQSRALLTLTRRVLELVDQHCISLIAYYLPGRFNGVADSLSRNQLPAEWHLLPPATSQVFSKWGTPVVDLFASEKAHVVENYVSIDPRDQRALFHNALSSQWDFKLAWVFPPPYLIPQVLQHLNQARGTYLIVTPLWHKVFWRADLKNRAREPPLTLTNLQTVLVNTSTGKPPPRLETLTLEVWRCGGGKNP